MFASFGTLLKFSIDFYIDFTYILCMAKLTDKLNFQITPDLRRQLFEFAKKKDWSVSMIIREAIKEYLERDTLKNDS